MFYYKDIIQYYILLYYIILSIIYIYILLYIQGGIIYFIHGQRLRKKYSPADFLFVANAPFSPSGFERREGSLAASAYHLVYLLALVTNERFDGSTDECNDDDDIRRLKS